MTTTIGPLTAVFATMTTKRDALIAFLSPHLAVDHAPESMYDLTVDARGLYLTALDSHHQMMVAAHLAPQIYGAPDHRERFAFKAGEFAKWLKSLPGKNSGPDVAVVIRWHEGNGELAATTGLSSVSYELVAAFNPTRVIPKVDLNKGVSRQIYPHDVLEGVKSAHNRSAEYVQLVYAPGVPHLGVHGLDKEFAAVTTHQVATPNAQPPILGAKGLYNTKFLRTALKSLPSAPCVLELATDQPVSMKWTHPILSFHFLLAPYIVSDE